jgi:hypothetical protein
MNIKIVSLLLLALLVGNAYCEIIEAAQEFADVQGLEYVDQELEYEDQEEGIELVARHPGHDTPEPSGSGSSSGRATQAPSRTSSGRATQAPTRQPSSSGRATQAPTRRPSSSGRATQAPTRRPSSSGRATQAPTRRPSNPTRSPSAPVTQAPSAPVTQAPSTPVNTRAPSTPVSGDLCALTPTSSEPVKLLVPLYVYPGAQWDQLIAAANSGVEIIAIINPSSGPGTRAEAAYGTYMKKMAAAGIDMVGYVHTTYGDRSINDVRNDINIYASQYPGLKGIFIDEASASASDIAYYTQVYQAITAKSGYTNVILNPGTQPDKGYLSISTNVVVFENAGSNFARTTFPSYVKCASSAAQKSGYSYRFGAIAYDVSSSAAPALLASMRNQGIGLVYVTDGAGGCCTYNNLVSYISSQANAVAALN